MNDQTIIQETETLLREYVERARQTPYNASFYRGIGLGVLALCLKLTHGSSSEIDPFFEILHKI